MLRTILDALPKLIESLNKTSIQRLVLYAFIIFNATIFYVYRVEISLMLSRNEQRIELTNVPSAQERCFILRQKYSAEAVIIYVYQPAGKNKSYKERIAFSTGDHFKPLSSMRNVNLFSRADIIADLNRQNYSLITAGSGHIDSSIVSSFDLQSAVITSIRSKDSNELVGEVVWIFKDDTANDFRKLILEGQIFSHLLTL